MQSTRALTQAHTHTHTHAHVYFWSDTCLSPLPRPPLDAHTHELAIFDILPILAPLSTFFNYS